MGKSRNFYLATLFCLTLSTAQEMHALVLMKAEWIQANTAMPWDVAGNWLSNPAGFPHLQSDIASFTLLRPTAASIVNDNGTPITIGELLISSQNGVSQLDLQLTHTLTFSSNSGISTIFCSGNAIIESPGITLDNELQIHLCPTGSTVGGLVITNISGGNFPLKIIGDPSSSSSSGEILVLDGNNSNFAGPIVLESGFLLVTSPNTIIPKSLEVGLLSEVQFLSSNNFAATATLNVVGGVCDLNDTIQTVAGASIVGPAFKSVGIFGLPNLFDSTDSGAPLAIDNPNGDSVLTLAEDAFIAQCQLFFFDNVSPGNNIIRFVSSATFDGSPSVNTTGHANIGDPSFFFGPVRIIAFDALTIEVASVHSQNDYDLGIFTTIIGSFSPTLAVTKTGPGNLLLGNDTEVDGTFTASEGVVTIGLTSSDACRVGFGFTVDAGATLQGVGTLDICSPQGVINNGIVAPGIPSTIGTLTLTEINCSGPLPSLNEGPDSGSLAIGAAPNTYIQSSSGELLIKALDTSSPNDLLVVNSGGVLLAGTLFVECQPGAKFSVGEQIMIIDNSGGTGITGDFTTKEGNLPEGLIYTTFILGGNQYFVQFQQGPCAPCPPCVPVVISQPPSLTRFFDPGAMLFSVRSEHNLQLSRRMQAARERFCSCEPASIYVAAFGTIGDTKGYDFNTAGGLIGFDYALSWGAFGVQVSYEHYDADIDHHWGDFEINEVFGEFYGTLAPFCNQNFFIDMAAGGGSDWYEIKRHTDEGTAKAKPHGWEWDAYLGLGYDSYFCDWRFTPLAAVKYINLEIDDYREHGAGDLDVTVSHQRRHSLRSWLGLSIGGTFESCWATWMPEVRGYWQHEFAEQHHHLHVASSTFNTTSEVEVFGEGRNFGVVGAELKSVFCGDVTAGVSYDFYWNENTTTNFLYGEVGFNF